MIEKKRGGRKVGSFFKVREGERKNRRSTRYEGSIHAALSIEPNVRSGRKIKKNKMRTISSKNKRNLQNNNKTKERRDT